MQEHGVSFPVTGKVHIVNGTDRHAFYEAIGDTLTEDAVPIWNFHKILIGRCGRVLHMSAAGLRDVGFCC